MILFRVYAQQFFTAENAEPAEDGIKKLRALCVLCGGEFVYGQGTYSGEQSNTLFGISIKPVHITSAVPTQVP